MKKRSLFAAVAMLLVSALVLTSATYAWFAASTKASLQSFSATVENNNGSIQISAQNTTGWTSTLDIDAVKAVQTGCVATSLSPVSFHWSNSYAPAFLGAKMESTEDNSTHAIVNTFKPNDATKGTHYTQFNVYVKADAVGYVKVTPTFSRNADFVYASISNGTETGKKVLAAGTDSYYPLISGLSTTGVVDGNDNSIIDSTDNGSSTYISNSVVEGVANTDGSITLQFTADDIAGTNGGSNVKTVTVCMWAEGQDPNCVGTVQESTNSLSLAFNYTTTNPDA